MLTLYHGSDRIIQHPEFGKGKIYNDYGQGFYCTEDKELAKEWACSDECNGFVNEYNMDATDLKVLSLIDPKYSVLHWLTILALNREFTASTPVARQALLYLKKEFTINISEYDLIIGYRADDSYFSFAKAFINNTISITQLARAMKFGDLGEQIVCKSPKAFKTIRFVNYELVNSYEYFNKRKTRDANARAAYAKEADNVDIEGVFMRDIIREGIKDGDLRL